jgi:signal transduction histidine kinase
VQLHGGSIEVESTLGAGSSFSVFIPFGKDHLPAERIGKPGAVEQASFHRDAYLYESKVSLPETLSSIEHESKRERVLLADDNADIRSYITRLLSQKYDVIAVENGRDAFEAALRNPPDIVVADIIMPVCDGFTLLRELRGHASTRSLPVILVSARAGEEASAEGMHAGADDYLVKPFTARELLSRVDAHLSLQRERRRAEARVMQVFQQAPVAICVLRGPNLVYELANPLYRELLHRWDILGRPLTEAVPELDAHIVSILRRVYTTGEPFAAPELHIPLDRDGDGVTEDYWFSVVCHALREYGGDISGVIVAAHEVTSQVVARTELEKVNRELEEFAYVASHDLQEPLRTVNIYTELLLRKRLGADDPEARRYAEFIGGGVHRMEQLIHDLLAYSRSVHSASPGAFLADVSDCIAAALNVLQDRIGESHARIEAEASAKVRADANQLTQVFQNLIGNAIKYSKQSVPPHIVITACRQEADWIISVKDNGIGFDPAYADKVFGLFKRLHGGTYPGTGLGLAICKRIVERFGGRIWAESAPGEGAIFHIALRAAD